MAGPEPQRVTAAWEVDVENEKVQPEDIAAAERDALVARLVAENERLRKALGTIARGAGMDHLKPRDVPGVMQDVARAAPSPAPVLDLGKVERALENLIAWYEDVSWNRLDRSREEIARGFSKERAVLATVREVTRA